MDAPIAGAYDFVTMIKAFTDQ